MRRTVNAVSERIAVTTPQKGKDMDDNKTMLDELDEEREEQNTFSIMDDKTAEWALKKIKEAEKEQNRLLALVDEERAALDVREKQITEQYENRTAHLKELLQDYLCRVYENGDASETKTQIAYPLLSGKLVMKKPAAKLDRDELMLSIWCLEHLPDALKVSYKPDWASIKKNVKMVDGVAIYEPTGEVVDGVMETTAEPEFKIV